MKRAAAGVEAAGSRNVPTPKHVPSMQFTVERKRLGIKSRLLHAFVAGKVI
jgi:hypothetical protein